MRFRTLEIRWHDSKPISTCDFQPISFKKARPGPGQEKNYAGQSYRLATGGEDNHVRIWMVHPHIRPPSVVEHDSASNPARPPRVEYLATLSRHSAAVNVVRFSPNGEHIASAGDDGMIIIWAPSTSPQPTTYGSDLSPEDLQHEKEYWKPRTTFRCTTMQVYDLAWSPTGEYIIAGSTDNVARVFSALDGKCVHEIVEHSHYVQGVAWDPLNEYIATQSSDRSMHVYRISTKQGAFEAHAVGKNTRMPHRHSRTPSTSRPRMFRRESTASDAESAVADYAKDSEDSLTLSKDQAPLTPAMSVLSTPSSMFPPPPIEPSSRRSSFSGSNAPSSPSTFTRYGRSPSPMPPLPAIRSLPSPSSWASVKLYGDESFTNFFRRLTFSPDGGLLLTPAGQFEDPSVIPSQSKQHAKDDSNTTPARGRKGRPSNAGEFTTTSNPAAAAATSPASSVYIYSRANFARPPIAQLPGHKKASVAVRFSPILYELRHGVEGAEGTHENETKTAALEKGMEGVVDVDVVGPLTVSEPSASTIGSATARYHASSLVTTHQRTTPTHGHTHSTSSTSSIVAPSPRLAIPTSGDENSHHQHYPRGSPALSPMDLRPPTPAASKPPTPVPSSSQGHAHSNPITCPAVRTGSVFALPYRMLFAVVTMDTVAIYDTQQAGPVCLLTKLHYDEFTDMTWSPDGQCLMLSSRDGYCTLIIFDEILPSHQKQQHALQLQSIAQHHSLPLSFASSHHNNNHNVSGAGPSSTVVTPAATPSSTTIGLPFVRESSHTTPTLSRKRHEPPLTPTASVDGGEHSLDFSSSSSTLGGLHQQGDIMVLDKDDGEVKDKIQEPPKKKRRVALTRVGDLD